MGSVANLSTPKNGEILIAATQVGGGVEGLAVAAAFQRRGALAGSEVRACAVYTGPNPGVHLSVF